MTLTLADFDFLLPEHCIAQQPATPRDSARLLCIAPDTSPKEAHIHNLVDLLEEGDVLVVNDTRVIPAQLNAFKNETPIGITLDRPANIPGHNLGHNLAWPQGSWHVLFRKAKRLKTGDILHFANHNATAEILAIEGGTGIVHFNTLGETFDTFLNTVGQLALPPYIERPNGPTEADLSSYHTLFARRNGAIAAPTAGLHFTPELMQKLQDKGITCKTVTLHVGPGTFLPVRHNTIAEHVMHAENGVLDKETAAYLNTARKAGRRIVAVGTTTLRLLESAADETGSLQPFSASTSIFITPGYQFRVVDVLLTNFHLPRSTLFMLVCAFSGLQTMKNAYNYAIEHNFRFYSYGDACLLYRSPPLAKVPS